MGAYNIPLSIHQPKFTTPLQAQQQRLSLQQLAGQVQIQRQMQQENALKIQAQQEDQEDQNTIKQAFLDHVADNPSDPSKLDFDKVIADVAPKIRIRNLQALQGEHLKMQQQATSLANSNIQADRDKALRLETNHKQVGQALAAVMQAPDEQKDTLYQSQLNQLKTAGIDVSAYPATRPDDDMLAAYAAGVGYIGNVYHNANLKAQKEQRDARAKQIQDEEDAKVAQRAREQAAARYQSVVTEDQHDKWKQWLADKHPEVHDEYKDLEYDPETTPTAVENMALTAQQRAGNEFKSRMAGAAEARAAVAGGRAGLVAGATDPSLTPKEREAKRAALDLYDKTNGPPTANAQMMQQRYQQKRADADSKEHTKLQQQEADQWAVRGRYGDVLKQAGVPEGETDPDKLAVTVKDPRNGKDITAAEALQLMSTAKDKATALQNQAEELRKRHGWGEFGQPAQTANTSPAAAPVAAQSATQGAPPANLLKEGVATKFKNGQIWTMKQGKPTQLQPQGQ